MHTLLRVSLIFCFLIVSGCQAEEAGNDVLPLEEVENPTSTLAPDATEQPIATPDRFGLEQTKQPEKVPTGEAGTPVTGEAPPELLEAIIDDLANRTGASINQIVVLQDQEVEWNDGSLGCPKAGEFYTQAIIEGYWVLLEFNGTQYDYRVGSGGLFILCERGVPPLPPSTPNS